MATETIPTAPAWARGYDVAELKRIVELFDEYDGDLRLGAFSGINERDIAAAMAENTLTTQYDLNGEPLAAAIIEQPRTTVAVRDFTGEIVARIPPGSRVVKRVAAQGPGQALRLLSLLKLAGYADWLESWVEHPVTEQIVDALGLWRRATKIRASSEIIGVYGPEFESAEAQAIGALQARDAHTLTRLRWGPPRAALVEALREAQEEVGAWADHYSSYNQRHSWSAVALRGYHPPGMPAELWHNSIEKPAEMAKRWKAEHPDWQEWPLEDGPLYAHLPACRQLVDTLVGQPERVRLMRLAPGGGELTRHADITDPTAGTAPGHYLRIHIPLLTNPDVRFRMWNLDGQQVEAHMEVDEAWYLDTRKPHTAGNYGTSERIHLVADIESNERLIRGLLEGREAEVVHD